MFSEGVMPRTAQYLGMDASTNLPVQHRTHLGSRLFFLAAYAPVFDADALSSRSISRGYMAYVVYPTVVEAVHRANQPHRLAGIRAEPRRPSHSNQ